MALESLSLSRSVLIIFLDAVAYFTAFVNKPRLLSFQLAGKGLNVVLIGRNQEKLNVVAREISTY